MQLQNKQNIGRKRERKPSHFAENKYCNKQRKSLKIEENVAR